MLVLPSGEVVGDLGGDEPRGFWDEVRELTRHFAGRTFAVEWRGGRAWVRFWDDPKERP